MASEIAGELADGGGSHIFEPLPIRAKLFDCGSQSQWLAQRKQGIGGSDVAAILGYDPFRTVGDVWLEKTGKAPPQDDCWEFRRGRALEPAIAAQVAEDTGRECIYPGPWVILQHPTIPILQCSLDRILKSPPEPQVLQIKTGVRWNWQDEGVPLYIQIQVQHEMLVSGLNSAIVAVSLDGNRPRMFNIAHDNDFCYAMIDYLPAWWKKHVVEGNKPDEMPQFDFVKSLEGDGRVIMIDESEAGNAVLAAAEHERELAVEITDLQAERETLRDIIKLAIGEASGCELPDGSGYSYKRQHRAGYYVSPTEYRALLRKRGRK
jgi:putative phage-type endonuclease